MLTLSIRIMTCDIPILLLLFMKIDWFAIKISYYYIKFLRSEISYFSVKICNVSTRDDVINGYLTNICL